MNRCRRLLRIVVAAWIGLGAPGRVSGQGRAPSPAEFHGFDVSTRYVITEAVLDYYRTLARTSPRAEYASYGRSIQGRELPMVTIGSEEDLARRDEIRSAMRRLAQADGPVSTTDAERIAAEMPAVVWIFIVDTDEEAGVNALQEVAYELTTGEEAEIRAIRDNVLVILTPLTNPDSHARYVTWHMLYDVPGAATDPLAVENRAHWGMNTDGNAWGVDVNRDFGFFVSPEMSALGRVVTDWRPHFFLDIHSGPNVIFLPPFPRPYHPLWPAEAPKWWNRVAERASENFGRRGWSFSSRKDYEGVAGVGFGLSWGMLGPAVTGFLYETFGGRPQKTTAFVRSDGTLATMRMAMDRHKLGIYSLLEVAAEDRQELLMDQHRRVEAALAEARRSPVRQVIVPASGAGVDPDKVTRLVDRLTLQEVEVRQATTPFTAQASDFLSLGDVQRRDFPGGTYVIDLVQPQARLARTLLDPTLDFTRPQVEVPYDRRMPYYDAPWGNLPFLFGVRAYASAQPLAVDGDRVEGRLSAWTTAGTVPTAPGSVEGLDRPEPPYAYVLEPGREASYRMATRLMREGYRVRVFRDATRIEGVDYPKGTLGLIRARNPAGLEDRLEVLAQEEGGRVVAVAGPFTDAGLTFGDDDRVAALPAPLVAVVADWPVNQDHTFGGIRATLEGDFRFPFSPVMLETVNRADLSKYTAVVLPHAGMDVRGGPNFNAGYRDRLDLDNLREYVTGGGTLIAIQGASTLVAQDPVLGAGIDVAGWAEQTEATLRAEFLTGLEPDTAVMTWRPGLADLGMPLLASGYPSPVFAAPGSFPLLFDLVEDGGAEVVARYGNDPATLVLDGFMLDEDRPILAGRPFVVVQSAGRGRVIYFAEDPTFRGYWYGLNLLFVNALLFGSFL